MIIMNITIFGASGQTGQIMLEKALSQEYQVTAYVRREDSTF
jgi:putative NADH-flavin reductase